MKRSILILSTTYYQLILALQMRETIFKENHVSLVITDTSQNTKNVADKLSSLNFFNKVYFWQIRKKFTDKYIIWNKLQLITGMIHDNKLCDFLNNDKFDELICHHTTVTEHILFAKLYKNNQNIIVSHYEEGVLSYNHMDASSFILKASCKFRKIMGKQNLQDKITKLFYCCFPEIYEGNFKSVKIPLLKQNGKVKEIAAYIFGVETDQLKYKEKYIMLTSVYDFEGGRPIGEFELARRCKNLVGGGNLLIKTHPRDLRDAYKKDDFNVDLHSVVPWEVIQLTVDFSDKVLLTVASGSALSVNMLLENPPKTFFLYNFCDVENNIAAKKSVDSIRTLLDDKRMAGRLGGISVAQELGDFITK